MSIFFNNSSINDWFFSTDNIIKVYRNNAVCYYKIDSSSPSGQTPCYAVVADISQYSDTEFEDVFNQADEKWYKLNNLNQYEEYGVYGSGRTITTYEGKLTIDTESTPQPSRLPQGYTEVEYIRQNSNYDAYINTGVILFDNTSNTYTITTRLTSEFHSNLGCATIISCERVNSPYDGLGYRYKCTSTVDQLEFFGGHPNYSSSSVDNGDGTMTITFTSSGNSSFTTDVPLSYMAAFSSTTYGANASWRHSDSTIYSATVVKNGVTVRDFVPAKRDSDDKYGLYDLITETFYTSPNDNNFSGGSEVIPPPITATCEFIYSGGSWVNLGEVSGSSKTSGFTILDIEGSGTTSSFGDGDYIVISYFNHNDPKTPSSMMSYKTQSGHNYQNDFSGHTGSNTITDNTIIDAAVWKLEVASTANTYYIKNIDTNEYFGYQNTSVNNSFYLVDSANKAPILIDDYNGGIGLIEMKQTVSSYYGGYGLNQLYGYTYRCNWLNNGSGSKANFYGNDGNALYVLYQVNDGGGLEYPVEYTVMQDPPDNLVFSSMAEAEAYECPWVGMSATIDGDKYVFSGDSQSGYEWVYNPSRLPIGYTEVEYVQNTSHAYLDIGFIPNQDTRIVCDMQQVTENSFPRLWGAGEWNSANGINLNYEGGYLQMSWFGKTSWTKITSVTTNNDRHTYDLNKNYLYVDETLVGSNTYTTKTAAASIGIFCEIRNNGQPPTSGNNPKYWEGEYFKGKMYSFQVYNNGTLVRDLVPCIRDNDNTVGAYDIVNDVFYTVPTGYTTDTLIAGNPV